jgi:hypothetical protein
MFHFTSAGISFFFVKHLRGAQSAMIRNLCTKLEEHFRIMVHFSSSANSWYFIWCSLASANSWYFKTKHHLSLVPYFFVKIIFRSTTCYFIRDMMSPFSFLNWCLATLVLVKSHVFFFLHIV